jgi:hypothetical protein
MTIKGLPDAGNQVWIEGQAINATLTRTSPISATISWNIPTAATTYYGAVVLLSLTEINPSNYPVDGQAYTASTLWGSPQDTIGSAQVVGAFYNDVTTTSVTITNLDPATVYYGTVHLSSNVRTYYSLGSKTYPQNVSTGAFAPSFDYEYSPPTNPFTGQIYFDVTARLLYRWDGATWVQITQDVIPTGFTNPAAGSFAGDMFYNISTRTLNTWNGSAWVDGSADNHGPIYNRFGVGTDLTTDERQNLIDILKKQMGAPVVCVELSEDQWNIAVDNAIQEIRHRVDNAYFKQYINVQMKANQNTYYLNDPRIGTDHVVDVIKIHRVNMLAQAQLNEGGIYAQQFLSQFFNPGVQVDLLSIHLINQMSEMFSNLFVGEISFNFRETTRELRLFRRLFVDERVLIECVMEKTEQELLSDRWMMQWIQQWSESEAMFMLSRIRGKYGNLPGPGGGLTMNAAELAADAQRLQEDCLRQIQDFEIGNGGSEFANYSFVIG